MGAMLSITTAAVASSDVNVRCCCFAQYRLMLIVLVQESAYSIAMNGVQYEDAALLRGLGSCVNHKISIEANATFCMHSSRYG
jgi:hypothetical protein